MTVYASRVLFFTFHKCASTLFKNLVLPNINGYNNIDIATDLYRGGEGTEIDLHKDGSIYGPLRLSAGPKTPLRALVIEPATSKDTLENALSVVFTRDPRDIIVSSYYSFSGTHSLSPNPAIREKQIKQREKMAKLSIDEFALRNGRNQLEAFSRAVKVTENSPNCRVFRYEDMVEKWSSFITSFKEVLPVNDDLYDKWYLASRPSVSEDTSKHKRSGKTNSYLTKLRPETVEILNAELAPILDKFGYTAT